MTCNQKCSLPKSKHFCSRVLTLWLSTRATGRIRDTCMFSSGSERSKTDKLLKWKVVRPFFIHFEFVYLYMSHQTKQRNCWSWKAVLKFSNNSVSRIIGLFCDNILIFRMENFEGQNEEKVSVFHFQQMCLLFSTQRKSK